MPIYLEAEDINGVIQHWVTDADTFAKLRSHLGDPIETDLLYGE